MIRYNPTIQYYTSPLGAVATGTTITLRYLAERSMDVTGVTMCLRRDDEVIYYPMDISSRDYEKDVYTLSLTIHNAGVYHYRYEMYTSHGVVYVGKDEDYNATYGEWLPEWRLVVYEEDYSPKYQVGGINYHIFVDRFCRESTLEGDYRPWGETPSVASADGKYRADDFFGGDFEGIRSRLGYLKSLGVTNIYLSPIYEAESNHRYDVGDFMRADSRLGSEEDFARLCADAKTLGMTIMLDGVFNHSGSNSVYFNKEGKYDTVGAYQDINSPYHDWYYFDTFPDGYKSWWGIRNVPTLNKDNPEYLSLILGEGGMIDKWMRLGVDNWRLDVADELPDHMLDDIRKVARRNNPDSIIVGEVWENAVTKVAYGQKRRYFIGRQLDGVTNYPFMNMIHDYVKGGDNSLVVKTVREYLEDYPHGSLMSSMTILDTHDTVRVINALSGEDMPDGRDAQAKTPLSREGYERGKRRLKMASVLQYILPGTPTVYYGDEVGLTGWSDPLNRACYPWGGEDEDLLEHYRLLGDIRRRYARQTAGGTFFVEGEILHLVRYADGVQLHLLMNNSPKSVKLWNTHHDIYTGSDKIVLEPLDYILYEERY